MQPIAWYWHRLRSMPPGEMLWRAGCAGQQLGDRVLAPLRAKALPVSRVLASRQAAASERDGRSAATGPAGVPGDAELCAWRQEVVERADDVRRGLLAIFDRQRCPVGDPVNWNFEYAARKATPLAFAPRVDYRDYSLVGDAKVVWEPNRHQHLVVLGRAYRLTGEVGYAAAVLDHLVSWIAQCPFGRGMNWRSPLELAVRVINWAWALDLIAPSGLLSNDVRARLLPVVYRHLWDIRRKYSRHSSANNHLIGEAAGVFVGCRRFPFLKHAGAWAARARAILLREIVRQTHDDGGTREQALGYHLFVLEFFVLAGLTARRTGEDFPPEYWARLERMFEFLAAMVEGGETAPMFGDCDDGYVLDLGCGEHRAAGLLAVGAVLFDRVDFLKRAGSGGEPVYWLLGDEGRRSLARLRERAETGNGALDAIRSRALEGSGYYLLQAGSRSADEHLSVVFDCGELGYGPIAAHGHADALSFTLRAFGEELLVDPGTYDYFSWPAWRDYFRSTRAHNTVVVDGQDQSEALGPFLWGRRARARCVQWRPSPDGGQVTGEHDGYTRLPDPVMHRRTLVLRRSAGELSIRDELTARADHEAAFFLHLAEGCRVHNLADGRCLVRSGRAEVLLHLDPRLELRVLHGSEDPPAGWVSRGYHRRTASTTLVGRCRWSGTLQLETRIVVEPLEQRQATPGGTAARCLARSGNP